MQGYIPRRINNTDSSADFSLSNAASVVTHIPVGFALETTAGYSMLRPSHSSRCPRLFGFGSRSVLRASHVQHPHGPTCSQVDSRKLAQKKKGVGAEPLSGRCCQWPARTVRPQSANGAATVARLPPPAPAVETLTVGSLLPLVTADLDWAQKAHVHVP